MVIYNNKTISIEQLASSVGAYKPLNIQIDLTHTCDSNCPFCLQGSSESRTDCMSTSKIFSLLTELKELGCYRVGFSGGEPLLRNDVKEILEYAARLGFRFSMVSNGHYITDDLIQTFVDVKLAHLTLSLHTVDSEKYKKIFGNAQFSVEHILETLKKLLDNGIHVGVAATLTKDNIDDVDALIDAVVRLGVAPEDVTLNPLLPGKKDINTLLPSEDQMEHLYEVLAARGMAANIREGGEKTNTLLCSAGKYSCQVRYNGDVFPCSMFECKAGNIYEQSFAQIWETAPIFIMLRSITYKHFEEPCGSCAARNTCRMCVWNNIVYNRNIFSPYEQTCNYSQMIKKITEEESKCN